MNKKLFFLFVVFALSALLFFSSNTGQGSVSVTPEIYLPPYTLSYSQTDEPGITILAYLDPSCPYSREWMRDVFPVLQWYIENAGVTVHVVPVAFASPDVSETVVRAVSCLQKQRGDVVSYWGDILNSFEMGETGLQTVSDIAYQHTTRDNEFRECFEKESVKSENKRAIANITLVPKIVVDGRVVENWGDTGVYSLYIENKTGILKK